ncbi:hypothetical protein D918_09035 [Trichuris suis]|nr:hypothetical protein D918_09035 [Trichuris suis]
MVYRGRIVIVFSAHFALRNDGYSEFTPSHSFADRERKTKEHGNGEVKTLLLVRSSCGIPFLCLLLNCRNVLYPDGFQSTMEPLAASRYKLESSLIDSRASCGFPMANYGLRLLRGNPYGSQEAVRPSGGHLPRSRPSS